MPFQSEKQRRYMHANLPDIAKRWERDYAGGGIAELNQELNSLPEYYMPFPAAQGGRIGFDKGSPLIIWGKPVDEQWDNLNEDQKKYIRENFPDQVPKEAAQGGLIPAHQAGIYGLEDGGQLVKSGPGRPGYNGQGDYTPDRSTGGGGPPGGGDPGMTYTAPPEAKPPQLGGPSTVEDAIKFRDTPPEDGPRKLDNITHGENEWQNLIVPGLLDKGKRVQKILASRALQKRKLDNITHGENEWQNLIVPGLLDKGKRVQKILEDRVRQNELINFGKGLEDKFENQFEGIEGHRADISQQDIDEFLNNTMAQNSDDDTAAEIIKMRTGNQTLTGTDVGIIRKYKEKTKPTGKFRIVTAEGGIIGLKQGGRTGFFTGMREAEQQERATRGPREDPDRFGPVQTVTPPGPDPQGDWGTTQEHIIKQEIDKQNLEKTEEWEKSKEAPWNKPTDKWAIARTLGKAAAAVYTLGGSLGWEVPGIIKTAAQANTFLSNVDRTVALAKRFNLIDENVTTESIATELMTKLGQGSAEREKKMDVYESLPPNHPERIALQAELEIGKKPPTAARDDGGTQETETGITYDDMEDTNRRELASVRWQQEQEKVENAKRAAYLAAFRQQYLMGPTAMAAGGGRVPAGYNTGGLSNLFKLKNV